MLHSEVTVGMRVYFGRPNGQKTLGEVVKINPKKLKIRILENRGGRSEKGGLWNVPSAMCTPADTSASTTGTMYFGVEPEDECPVCQSGTLEDNGTEVQCRGECGSIFRKALVVV